VWNHEGQTKEYKNGTCELHLAKQVIKITAHLQVVSEVMGFFQIGKRKDSLKQEVSYRQIKI